MSLSSCPACGGGNFMAAVSAAALRAESEERYRFIVSRLRRKPDPAESKDLTDFMHDDPDRLVQCKRCGLLLRDEPRVRATDSYEEDPNDPDLMSSVYPRYVEAFRNKAPAWRDRLRPHGTVLELGSHLGAFLQVAEEWNWNAAGLDIGRDTSAFARRMGLTVRRETIEDTKWKSGSADALFIWNCFEQLGDPDSTLRHARRLLARHGLLVLRVPNARFYMEQRNRNPLILAWNNLLGFPYLYGHTEQTLNRLAIRYGFEPVRGFNSELVTLPLADPTAAVTREQMDVSAKTGANTARTTAERGVLTGPWIEVIYRKEHEVKRFGPKLDQRFLERAA